MSGIVIHGLPGHRSGPNHHEGNEIFLALAGARTVEIKGRAHILGRGDRVHFCSRRVHAIWNHGRTDTVLLHVCTIDVFGDGAAARGCDAVNDI